MLVFDKHFQTKAEQAIVDAGQASNLLEWQAGLLRVGCLPLFDGSQRLLLVPLENLWRDNAMLVFNEGVGREQGVDFKVCQIEQTTQLGATAAIGSGLKPVLEYLGQGFWLGE